MKSDFTNGHPARPGQRGCLRRCAGVLRTVCLPVLLIMVAASIWGQARAQVARAAQTGGSSTGNIQNGKRIFASQDCIECHGSEGQGGSAQVVGPRIGSTTLPLAMFVEKVRDAMKPMPAYAS